MKKLNTIIIYRNVHTPINLDLSSFNFEEGSKLVWTIKAEENGPVLIQREFEEARIYNELITPEEASKLIAKNYFYNFVLVLSNGTLLNQCLISDIEVRGVVYGSNN